MCEPGYYWDANSTTGSPACTAVSTSGSVTGLIIAGSIIGAVGVGGIIAAPFLMKSAVAAAAAPAYVAQVPFQAPVYAAQQIPVAYTANMPAGQPSAYQVVQYGQGAQYSQGGQYGGYQVSQGTGYAQNSYQALNQDYSAQGINVNQRTL